MRLQHTHHDAPTIAAGDSPPFFSFSNPATHPWFFLAPTRYYIDDLNEWYEAYGLEPHKPSEQPHTPREPTVSMRERMRNYGNACKGFLYLWRQCDDDGDDGARRAQLESDYIHAVLDSYWRRGNKNVHDPEFVRATLEATLQRSVDAAELREFLGNKVVTDTIVGWGKDAAARGAFGVPTMFVAHDHMYVPHVTALERGAGEKRGPLRFAGHESQKLETRH